MIDDKLRFDVNGDGTISVEYEDRQYWSAIQIPLAVPWLRMATPKKGEA